MNESDEPGNDLPPYSYVPGGPWPHPISDPSGHSFGERHSSVAPIAGGGAWRESASYQRGVDLFNRGYYWEAHEAWESLWHAEGRRGPTADLVKALIKLAAAGVKVREGQPHGVTTHAGRALVLIEEVRAEVGRFWIGLDLEDLAGFARSLTRKTPIDTNGIEAAVSIVFDFRLEPR